MWHSFLNIDLELVFVLFVCLLVCLFFSSIYIFRQQADAVHLQARWRGRSRLWLRMRRAVAVRLLIVLSVVVEMQIRRAGYECRCVDAVCSR